MNYNIDIQKFTRNYLPPVLRKNKVLYFLYSLLNPLGELITDFGLFRDVSFFESSITPQTIWIEKLLNDRFDNSLRRISIIHYIDDVLVGYYDDEGQAAIIGYIDSEGQPANVGYFQNEALGVLPLDFRVLVKIPTSNAVIGYFDSEGFEAIIGYSDSEGFEGIIGYSDSETPLFNQINALVNKYKQAGKLFDISF